ncbi:MOSC domain-containing protein [Lujinxingia litoralis]|uniref:MOSC domain-containing protein n=1 Tax=Lujinxingia litoralis TaxID=2211119 RepID=A0A328CBA5_9DELT|nr:MOSC domain-containing protein [Lujinxingia litoralis]RAL25134.1 MOSC domain-containing protein [Lujinxingia litoralis]
MHERWKGHVQSIWLSKEHGAPPLPVTRAEAVAGRGIRGDRYFSDAFTRDPARQLTLITREALDDVAQNHGIDLRHGRHRRQVVVVGVPLNDLVGQEFLLGPLRLRGVELCEPCRHLERLCAEPGAIKAFVHRGGLNAEILLGGAFSPGDPITPTLPRQNAPF